jgi:hypothetical protein
VMIYRKLERVFAFQPPIELQTRQMHGDCLEPTKHLSTSDDWTRKTEPEGFRENLHKIIMNS